MMITRFPVFLLLAAMVYCSPAFALSESQPLQADHRVRLVIYQPDQVYLFNGHYRYQSVIEFGQNEEIKTISMGDSTAWMINPSGNRLFLKPLEQDATTNMTVITSDHTYLFELHARETDDIQDKDMVFVMRFNYTSGDMSQTVSRYLDTVPSMDTEGDVKKHNFKYSISGSEDIAPIRIFDDGEFTYFQFRDKNAEVPAFYTVDRLGNEAIINYRTRGDYIVVERVSARMTLRHGIDIACVFNEAWNPGKVELPPAN